MQLESFVSEACALLNDDIDVLSRLAKKLAGSPTTREKIAVLCMEEGIEQDALSTSSLTLEEQLIVLSIFAIGQADRLFGEDEFSFASLTNKQKSLVQTLLPVESFYKEMGGLVGYHVHMIRHLCRPELRFDVTSCEYLSPDPLDISLPSEDVDEMLYAGLEAMGSLCEIYPVGGAADRLNLLDPQTGMALPAARLEFCGMTLLERLIEDLQAKEYLHYKLFGKQVTVPIAMMTSQEKDNHQQILSICEEKQWFHRKKNRFFFFCQPLVPTMDKQGQWGLSGPEQLVLKPGGHGVIWKLAKDAGIFSSLQAAGVRKALVRQINNPIAGEDYGLVAFCGYGLKENKQFGFCSCPRQVKAAEGVNVLVKEKKGAAHSYTLTNIEYCDFHKYRIKDEPVFDGGFYSKFPSNTNLLFVDIQAIEEAANASSLPGVLVNLKKMLVKNSEDQWQCLELARLESTMQNIADCFSCSSFSSDEVPSLPAYITHNERRKTISTIKREYEEGSSLLETPEGCFLDVRQNTKNLLKNYCGFTMPKWKGEEEINYPSFLCSYHSALGPFYSIIAQKISRGILHEGAELELSIAELSMKDVDVSGSLRIIAENIMGSRNAFDELVYAEQSGKCDLSHVSICNEGVDYTKESSFWRGSFQRKESCTIVLEGCAEFCAYDVTLRGNHCFRVEDGCRLTVTEKEGRLICHKETIKEPTWFWKYSFNERKKITLHKIVKQKV